MLMKRSRGVGSKQGLVAYFSSLPSPSGKYSRPTTTPFTSPYPFVGSFAGKRYLESDYMMSPTSTLEAKRLAAIGSSVSSDRKPKKIPLEVDKRTSDSRCASLKNGRSRGIGLGIVDALKDEETMGKPSKLESKMVLFGSQLKIQIPPLLPTLKTPVIGSPCSPIEFGIKTKDLLLGSLSPAWRSSIGSGNSGPAALSSRVFVGSFSLVETELSEDYTCVITHGPNPKTTHIFDNYVVESCGDHSPASVKETSFLIDQLEYPSSGFLSFCHTCRKGLGQGKDTYIYRGEKAFCSNECRHQGMMLDEEMDECSMNLIDDL